MSLVQMQVGEEEKGNVGHGRREEEDDGIGGFGKDRV